MTILFVFHSFFVIRFVLVVVVAFCCHRVCPQRMTFNSNGEFHSDDQTNTKSHLFICVHRPKSEHRSIHKCLLSNRNIFNKLIPLFQCSVCDFSARCHFRCSSLSIVSSSHRLSMSDVLVMRQIRWKIVRNHIKSFQNYAVVCVQATTVFFFVFTETFLDITCHRQQKKHWFDLDIIRS